jgi:hypothetical protein
MENDCENKTFINAGKDFDYGRTYGRLTSQAASQFAGITA